ncbi:hypothetical protein H6G45_03985 [Synechocystis sp. FACHB-383]|nr:hypothetical protein [Synechocystis sp. FACHB-383]MBD2652670.1 hypothetical protein [Synechocystis sp. FACHB-383]
MTIQYIPLADRLDPNVQNVSLSTSIFLNGDIGSARVEPVGVGFCTLL